MSKKNWSCPPKQDPDVYKALGPPADAYWRQVEAKVQEDLKPKNYFQEYRELIHKHPVYDHFVYDIGEAQSWPQVASDIRCVSYLKEQDPTYLYKYHGNRRLRRARFRKFPYYK